jgi:uncharacterized protein with FMN-binding domain
MRRVIAALVVTAAGLTAVLLYRTPTTRTSASQPSTSRRPTPSPTTTQDARTGVFTGPKVQAYQRKMGYVFGVVQVAVTLQAGRIVRVRTPVVPPVGDTGGRGTQPITSSITDFAVPILEQEAVSAQSARIHTVSGATYTSEAFIGSLQAALAQVRA